MSTLAASSSSTRSALVAEIRTRLDRESFPRFIVVVMLLVAGGAAFLISVLALNAGLASMAARYALATAGGYLVFLLLIRMWIAVRRGGTFDVASDVANSIDPSSGPETTDPSDSFEAHRSSERSGTGWDDVPVERVAPRGAADAGGRAAGEAAGEVVEAAASSLDLDELWWLVVAAAVVCSGLVAIGFIVYSAPLLLAEVALDAALVSAVYQRLRREDAGHWATTALRRTWVSAITLAACMAILGFALQQMAPDARSIGGVVGHLLAD